MLVYRFYDAEEDKESAPRLLRQMLEDQSENVPSQVEFSNLLTKLLQSAFDMTVSDSKDLRLREAGIVVLDCLMEVTDELYPDRRTLIAKHLKRVIAIDKYSLDQSSGFLKAAALSLGRFSRIANTSEIDMLQDDFVVTCTTWLHDQKSECHRFASVTLLTEFALNSPSIIHNKRKNIFSNLFNVLCDKSSIVREAAGVCLRVSLQIVSQRESIVEYVRAALNQVDAGFLSNAPERVLGSLVILGVLVDSLVISSSELVQIINTKSAARATAGSKPHAVVADMIWRVLQRRDSKELEIRKKTVEILPKLAGSFSVAFVAQNPYTGASNFLVFSLQYLLSSIRARKDRGTCFLALGRLFMSASSSLRTIDMMHDILPVIDEGFKYPFCPEALRCLTMLVNTSLTSRRCIGLKLIDNFFNGGLTPDLMECLKALMRHVPSVRGHIQERLRQQVSTLLLSHSVMVDDGHYGRPLNRVAISALAPRTTATGRDSVAPSPSRPASTRSILPFFSSSNSSANKDSANKSVGGAGAAGSNGCTAGEDAGNGSVGGQNNSAVERELVLAVQVLASFDFFPKQIQDPRRTTVVVVNSAGKVLSASPAGKASRNSMGKVEQQLEVDQNPLLLWIVRDAVIRFLDDSNPKLRMAAAVTAITVIDKVVGAAAELDADAAACVGRIIDRLLMLGVGDENAEIRSQVFKMLTPSLDLAISRSQNISCLIEGLNDEHVAVKTSAISVLCRIAHFDQVHIMPLVRVVLKRTMRRLQSSKDVKLRAETVTMLQAIVRGSNTLIVPYVDFLLQPLLVLLQDSSTSIVGGALSSIGELALVSPEHVRGHLGAVFPALIKALYDVSSIENQETAVVTLGKLVSSSVQLVTEPYTKYPQLLEGIIKAIQNTSEEAAELRLQAIRTAGLLGTVDAELYQKYLQDDISHHTAATEDEDEEDGGRDTHMDMDEINAVLDRVKKDQENSNSAVGSVNRIEKYIVETIFRGVVVCLNDSTLSTQHAGAATIAGRVVAILTVEPDCYLPLDDLFKALVQRLYKTNVGNNLQTVLLDQLMAIINVIGMRVLKYQNIITQLISDFFQKRLQHCLDFVEALSLVLPVQNFNNVFRSVLPAILITLRTEPNELIGMEPLSSRDGKGTFQTLPKTKCILQTIANISGSLMEFRQQLVTVILSVLDTKKIQPQTVKCAICTVMHLANSADLIVFASQIIQPLMRLIAHPNVPLQGTAFTSLSYILCKLERGFVPYILPVRRKIRAAQSSARKDTSTGGSASSGSSSSVATEKIPQLVEYEALVLKLLKHRPLPDEPSTMSDISISNNAMAALRSMAANNMASASVGAVNLQAIETAWALSRTTSADITEWMGRLSVEFIRQSPTPIVRQCILLAKNYRPLAQLLLNGAFFAIWNEVFAAQSSQRVVEDIGLIHAIEIALQSTDIPSNVLHSLLDLAEFMEMQDRGLPINTHLLAKQAQAANKYAKCMRYRELEFLCTNLSPSSECIESLIWVNNQLGLHDAAMGVLSSVQVQYKDMAIRPAWLEELNKWDDARLAYEAVMRRWEGERPQDLPCMHAEWMHSELGLLRCLYTLGEFEELNVSAISLRNQLRDNLSVAIANSTEDVSLENHHGWMAEVQRHGANAAWMLGKWDVMEEFLDTEVFFVGSGRQETQDVSLHNNSSFYKAVVAIHKEDYTSATALITETRSTLADTLGSLMNSSYNRAYHGMVTMQVLSEMEEVIEYKQAVSLASLEMSEQQALNNNMPLPRISSPNPAFNPRKDLSRQSVSVSNSNISASTTAYLARKKIELLEKWRKRIKNAPRDVRVFRQILGVHTLVADPREDLDSWLQFTSICRKQGFYALCESTLRRLGAVNIPITEYSSGTAIEAHNREMSALNSRRNSSAASLPESLGSSTPSPALDNSPGSTPIPSTGVALFVNDSPGGSSHPPSGALHSLPAASGMHHRVALSACKYLWSIKEKHRALHEIKDLLRTLPRVDKLSPLAEKSKTDIRWFKVKALLKSAEWMRELYALSDQNVLGEILQAVRNARDLAPEYYDVWHAWAVTNFLQLQRTSDNAPDKSGALTSIPETKEVTDTPKGARPSARTSSSSIKSSRDKRASIANLVSTQSSRNFDDPVTPIVLEAIKGFIRSINYGQSQSLATTLQDTLRLLTLWFSYGTKDAVYQLLQVELETVSAEHWLAVIPQLIARLHIRNPEISGLLRKMLIKIADTHPQALVCPISVAYNTTHAQQRVVASEVIIEMRKKNTKLMDEATMLSRELMRVAMTPHELWHGGLEKAAQYYVSDRDVDGMLAALTELHESLDESAFGPADTPPKADGDATPLAAFSENMGKIGFSTLRDVAFRQYYGRDLEHARLWLSRYRQSKSTADLHQAWEIYQTVFKRITAQLKTFTKLELRHVSVDLTTAKSLSLVVPGTYRPFSGLIGIQSFAPSVDVIASKQRPRKMSMWGADGKNYMFLLKGNEDLRQDERVMQLFGLINACLVNDRSTKSRGISITRYSVLPISNNSGVIGWVKNCDTLNQLVKEYRKTNKVHLDLERRLIAQRTGAPDDVLCTRFDKMPLIHKLNIFQQVTNETSGSDLQKMLWLTSKSSEVWIERRTNFTKSLAVMSIVGYILGLGDRHPSNLMLDRVSGQVVHIDFGDCFEVAKTRSKYPETVPFRLSRMLVRAMESSGIEGTFKTTCESVSFYSHFIHICVPRVPGLCAVFAVVCRVLPISNRGCLCCFALLQVMNVMRMNKDSVMAMLEAFAYDPLISWRLLATEGVKAEGAAAGVSPASADGSEGDRESLTVAIESLLQTSEPAGAADMSGQEGGARRARLGTSELELVGGTDGTINERYSRCSPIADDCVGVCL